MASGPATQISDVVVPSVFTPYTQTQTEVKSRLIRSGAMVRDEAIDMLLNGGGKTFNSPSWNDLDDDADRVATDDPHAEFSGGSAEPDPFKIESKEEVLVRLVRTASWSSMRLSSLLAGSDPMTAIANAVGRYWARRLQDIFIATWKGVFADNDANDGGDYTNDISGSAYAKGVTDVSAEASLDTFQTLGDSSDGLGLAFMHSVVHTKLKKNNLIDFIPDARSEVKIETYLDHVVVVDDNMPSPSTNVYETWFFGPGSTRFGVGRHPRPTAIENKEGAGNGNGQEIMYNRNVWCVHPVGHAYTGTAPNGGPSNAATTNNLADAGSWDRVFPERKQIKVARLISREA